MCPVILHDRWAGCGVDQKQRLDPDWVKDISRRREAAEQHLGKSPASALSLERAMTVLVKRDLPALLAELTRLRPELTHIGAANPAPSQPESQDGNSR
jgi:hypothetical protein